MTLRASLTYCGNPMRVDTPRAPTHGCRWCLGPVELLGPGSCLPWAGQCPQGRGRGGSLSSPVAPRRPSLAESAQGKAFLPGASRDSSCFNGVTPRAGHKHYHRWCPVTSGPQFGSQAGRPGGGTHVRISCRPALPCLWMETSSLGAGISKVQREKGEGVSRGAEASRCNSKAGTAGLPSLGPAPAHLAGASHTDRHVGVQSPQGRLLRLAGARARGCVLVVSLLGFNASRHPTPHMKIPTARVRWYTNPQSQTGSLSWGL